GLDEATDLAAGTESGARTQVGEGPDVGPLPHHGELGVGAHDPGAGADLAVLEGGVRPDDRVLAHHGRAQQLGAGQDRDVLLEDHVGVDPGGGRVHHGDSVAHPPGDDATVELTTQLGELGAVVGALGLAYV